MQPTNNTFKKVGLTARILLINLKAFYVINGGTMCKLTPAIFLFISCENQEEAD